MITPTDIETKEFKKSTLGGYVAEDVDRFLDEVILDYDKILRENIELKDKIGMLNEGIQYYKSLEHTIQSTLVLAEKTGEETKVIAQKKSEQIIAAAEQEASQIVFDANRRLQDINHETSRIKTQYEIIKTKIKLLLKAELELLNAPEIGIDTKDDDDN